MTLTRRLGRAAVAVALAVLSAFGQKQQDLKWVQTFQISSGNYTFALPGADVSDAMRPHDSPTGSFRNRFSISVGGTKARIQLTNAQPDRPLAVEGASIGLAAAGINMVPGSVRQLMFGGREAIIIPPGASVISDSLDLPLKPMAELIATVYTHESITLWPLGGTTLFLTEGDSTMDESVASTRKLVSRPLVTGVFVTPDRPTHVTVVLGDSISDANREDPTTPHGWVNEVNQRESVRAGKAAVAVVTGAISGNRLLGPGFGPAGLARLDQDIFSVAGLSRLVIFEGINDIGFSGKSGLGDNPNVSAEDLIAAYQQIATRAHMRGVKVCIGTLGPFEGSFYYSREKEKTREKVNDWIRASTNFDGIIDFDRIMRDPKHPSHMNPAFDS